MKRLKITVLFVLLLMGLTGCAVVENGYWNGADGYESCYSLLPLYDDALAASFLNQTNKEEVVNLTTEQADELFNHIEVFGANLTLPIKVGDLPEGFGVTIDKESFCNLDGSLYLTLAFGDNRLWYSDGEQTIVVAYIEILTSGTDDEDIENGYIVFLQTDILSNVSLKADCVGAGEFFNDELTQKYGEGSFSRHTGKYLCRAYSDGNRTLEIQYVGIWADDSEDEAPENREIDIDRTIRETTPLVVELKAFPDIEQIYSYEDGGV